MPYVKQDRRNFFSDITGTVAEAFLTDFQSLTAGDLNYLFTVISKEYIKVKGQNYQNYNDVVGALEGAKLELYRRSIAPYEDTKIKQNGDV